MRVALASLFLALSLTGCATLAPARDPFNGGGAQSFRLDVENRNFYDATIYVIQDTGTARRVGDVVGNGSRSFQVPWDFASDMRIRIELLANGSCTTAPLTVGPGEVLGLQIVADFARSAYCQ